MPANKLYPDNFKDINKTLMVQDIINLFLALFTILLIDPEFASLFIFAL